MKLIPDDPDADLSNDRDARELRRLQTRAVALLAESESLQGRTGEAARWRLMAIAAEAAEIRAGVVRLEANIACDLIRRMASISEETGKKLS
jgi:hypothetical protein